MARCPSATIFHSSAWLRAVADSFRVYAFRSAGTIVGGFPVAVSGSGPFRLGHQPKLTPYLGIVASADATNPAARSSFIKGLASSAAETLLAELDSVAIHFTPDWVDLQPFLWAGFEGSIRYTYVLSGLSPDQVWNGMDPKRRNDIRRAEREGIVVEVAGEFGEISTLVAATFARQGLSAGFLPVSRRVWTAMQERGSGRGFVAKDGEGRAIACCYVVWDDRRAYYLLGGYDSANAHGGAQSLALRHAIDYTLGELGLQEFDFEGSQIPALEKFFRSFGGKLTPYFRAEWSSRRAGAYAGVRKRVSRALRPLLELGKGNRISKKGRK